MSASPLCTRPISPTSTESRKRQRQCFTRSKSGCLTCRRQKKKCDEGRPECTRCVALKKTCDYPPESPRSTSGRTPTPQSRLTPSSVRVEADLVGDSSYNSRSEHQPDRPASTLFDHDYPEWSLADIGVENGPVSNVPRMDDIAPASAVAPVLSDMNNLPASPHDIASSFNETLGSSDPFWELFSQPLTQPVIPSLSTSPSVPITPSAQLQPSGAVLSVPSTCDSSSWSSFVDSSLWHTRPVSGTDTDRPLLEHFSTFASTTIVVRHTPTSASAFFAELADKATQDNQAASMHSVSCTSAVHLANWAAKVNDLDKAVHFSQVAAQHRAQALHLLRIASAKREGFDEEIMAATMVSSTLSGVLRGDTDVMPSFLRRTSTMLARIKQPREDTLLPAVSALHSSYTSIHAVASGQQVDINTLFPRLDKRDIWDKRSHDVVESVLGIRKEMLLSFMRVHSLVVEHDTIAAAMERDKEDDESAMMQIELHSECSTIETESRSKAQWTAKYVTDCVERTRIGHECFRLVINMMILREIFKHPSSHPRAQHLCAEAIDWMEKCPSGMEIGSILPQIILGTEASETLQGRYRAFYTRCNWKGSAPPRIASEISEEAWKRRRESQDISWRTMMLEKGSPVSI